VTIPAGSSDPNGDLKFALDTLFNHPNTPVFVSKQLIQHLVTSNPSPAYLQRVAAVFKDNRRPHCAGGEPPGLLCAAGWLRHARYPGQASFDVAQPAGRCIRILRSAYGHCRPEQPGDAVYRVGLRPDTNRQQRWHRSRLGSHHIVAGGGVAGQNIYGEYPVVGANQANDAGAGRLIPTTAVEQYGGTLGRWMGLSDSQVHEVFPNFGNFGSNPYLGLMG
jgi:hypothetical protein